MFVLLLAVYLPENEPAKRGAEPGATVNGTAEIPLAAAPTPLAGSSPQPTTVPEEAAEEAYDAPSKLHCGAERWQVKTLSDPDASGRCHWRRPSFLRAALPGAD